MQNKDSNTTYDQAFDLTNCNAEPLRHIRRVQSYGALLVTDQALTKWYYCSANLKENLSDKSLNSFLAELLQDQELTQFIKSKTEEPLQVSIGEVNYLLSKHSDDQLVYLEFEKIEISIALQTDISKIQHSILAISESKSLEVILDKILIEVQKLTGFTHTMIYEFDKDFNGKVIRELKNNSRPSYLGLKFPASDIPEQARALYFEESIRSIADVDADQLILSQNPALECQQKVNLAKVHVRGVSPIHLEYLKNINVKASFSVAIIKNDKLWGLIACHHNEPKIIDYHTRKWLKFLSNIISANINSLSREMISNTKLQKHLDQKSILQNLLESKDLVQSIVMNDPNILSLINATGVFVKSGSDIGGSGNLPDRSKLDKLIEWLGLQGPFDVLQENKSKTILPEDVYEDTIAGILAIQLSESSQDYIIFFRPVESKDVMWAGDPTKTKSFDREKGRLTPRKSFEKWVENTRDTASKWKSEEIETAKHIKGEIREFLYQKYNELDLLNKELDQAYKSLESFSYTVSHDLKSPLRAIGGFSQILVEDYSDKLDESGLDLLSMINSSITRMNIFIEDILNFSKLNKAELRFREVDLNYLIKDVWEEFRIVSPQSTLNYKDNLPSLNGDPTQIKQVFRNLISNSIKYTRKGCNPEMHLDFEVNNNYAIFNFADNGIGIPEHQRDKVFEIFQRLVRDDEYEGTGIGLAIVKKVIERHKGEIQIESNNNGGTTFRLSLPMSN